MPRFARPIPAGIFAHVVMRGNARATVFHSAHDYDEFSRVIAGATEHAPVDVLGWCLMPNHVHLIVKPREDGALGRFMHWLSTTHVQRHHARHSTLGRVWQGRYKAFPIQADRHFLMALRYVERNPVRAALVERCTDWTWSSARQHPAPECGAGFLAPSPVALPEPWSEWVDEPLTAAELTRVRESVRRDRPFGELAWARGMADRLGLTGTFRSRGRPRAVVLTDLTRNG